MEWLGRAVAAVMAVSHPSLVKWLSHAAAAVLAPQQPWPRIVQIDCAAVRWLGRAVADEMAGNTFVRESYDVTPSMGGWPSHDIADLMAG